MKNIYVMIISKEKAINLIVLEHGRGWASSQEEDMMDVITS